jgi:hypothetical protein
MVEDCSTYGSKIMHHNVQSLNNKIPELKLTLSINDFNMDILCLTEHWLSSDHMYVVKFDKFVLSGNFSRTVSGGGGGGGFCILDKDHMQKKEVNYIKELGSDKNFEVSAVEILNLNTIIVCMYRSPEGGFYEFLAKMEMVINTVQL